MIDLDPGEKIVLKVRRHKFSLFLECLFLVVFIILPPLVYILGGTVDYSFRLPGNTFFLFMFLYSSALLFAWILFFVIWTNYYLDVLIVTDKRIIDVEQKGFFHRELSTLRLDKIQDITVTVSGILATFLDFGTMRIQTAGESTEFVMRDVPEPNRVKSIIYELHSKQAEAPQSVKVVP